MLPPLPYVAAVHPITGGIAPTIAPSHVFHSDLGFIRVYPNPYNKMFPAPSVAVTGFVNDVSRAVPVKPVVRARPLAN